MNNKFSITANEIFYDGVLFAVISPAAMPTFRDRASTDLLGSSSCDDEETEKRLTDEYDAGYDAGYEDGKALNNDQ